MSGKFFEVNKGSNQHQKFIVDEDRDDEGYGVKYLTMMPMMAMTLTMKIKSLFVPQEEQSPKLAINLIECCRIVKFNCENM